MELISQHNHTDMTMHGNAVLEELVEHAAKLGMANLAVTEHYPLTTEMDPRNYVSMDRARLPEYFQRIKALRERHPQMELLIGAELDWLGDDEDRHFAPDEFDGFDIVLGSVHFLDRWPFDDPAQAGRWEEEGHDRIWRRYFEVWCQAAVSDMPFTVMAHPDLVKKFGHRPSFDPLPLYREAAEAAREGGRMVEVNTSGAFYACKEMFPAQAFLAEFRKAGVPCTIGSDAHDVANVDRKLVDGLRWMHEAGYREVTVVVPGGDRRTVAL